MAFIFRCEHVGSRKPSSDSPNRREPHFRSVVVGWQPWSSQPMTHPWDERYVDLHENHKNQPNVGKQWSIVWPTNQNIFWTLIDTEETLKFMLGHQQHATLGGGLGFSMLTSWPMDAINVSAQNLPNMGQMIFPNILYHLYSKSYPNWLHFFFQRVRNNNS